MSKTKRNKKVPIKSCRSQLRSMCVREAKVRSSKWQVPPYHWGPSTKTSVQVPPGSLKLCDGPLDAVNIMLPLVRWLRSGFRSRARRNVLFIQHKYTHQPCLPPPACAERLPKLELKSPRKKSVELRRHTSRAAEKSDTFETILRLCVHIQITL